MSTSILLNSCRQESISEKSLVGPFHGDPFVGQLSTRPVSSVRISKDYILEVYWEKVSIHPIICLRDAQGANVWARILVPLLDGQEEPRGQITSLTLNDVKTSGNTVKVMLSCDWTGGGKEGGIIYLNPSYSFQSFSLGW